MKRFMAILCAIALFGASLSAQEADTLVVIVKHDNSGNTFFEKVGYEYQLGCWGNGDGVHTHQVKCGVGFTF